MDNKRIKTMFVLPSLKSGGAERVISFVATNIDKSKFENILVIIGSEKDAVYATDGIEVHYLNCSRVLKSINPLFKLIKVTQPDIVMGSIAHVNRVLTMLSAYFRKVKFIGREASLDRVITKYSYNKKRIKYWKFYKNYYKHLDMIICQSKEMAQNLHDRYDIKDDKLAIINNPISGNLPARTNPINSENTRQLITIGRLSEEKGHERILEVLSKLKTPFHYTIIGKGHLETQIIEKASELHLSKHITHIPYTNDVAKYLSKSDLFLQGSYVEGFPNALLESCAVGTPVVAFRAPGGTQEILENDVNGFLAEDESDFFKKINNALYAKEWDSEKIRHSVYSRFNQEVILSKYETILETLQLSNKISS